MAIWPFWPFYLFFYFLIVGSVCFQESFITVVSLFPQSLSNANANSRSPSKTKSKNSLFLRSLKNKTADQTLFLPSPSFSSARSPITIFFVDFPNSPISLRFSLSDSDPCFHTQHTTVA